MTNYPISASFTLRASKSDDLFFLNEIVIASNLLMLGNFK
jgi:hypothetical protein